MLRCGCLKTASPSEAGSWAIGSDASWTGCASICAEDAYKNGLWSVVAAMSSNRFVRYSGNCLNVARNALKVTTKCEYMGLSEIAASPWLRRAGSGTRCHAGPKRVRSEGHKQLCFCVAAEGIGICYCTTFARHLLPTAAHSCTPVEYLLLLFCKVPTNKPTPCSEPRVLQTK
jgi:hypothetical protein